MSTFFYEIGRRHPFVEARAVPEGRFGTAPWVSGSPHAGAFRWALLTGALALALAMPGAGFAEERTSADAVNAPAVGDEEEQRIAPAQA